MTGISVYTGLSQFDAYMQTVQFTDKQYRWGSSGASYMSMAVISSPADIKGVTYLRIDLAFAFPTGKVKTQTALIDPNFRVTPVGSKHYNNYTYDDLERDFNLPDAIHNFGSVPDYENHVANLSSVPASSFDQANWNGSTLRLV